MKTFLLCFMAFNIVAFLFSTVFFVVVVRDGNVLATGIQLLGMVIQSGVFILNVCSYQNLPK